jgi:hypothetical protein
MGMLLVHYNMFHRSGIDDVDLFWQGRDFQLLGWPLMSVRG